MILNGLSWADSLVSETRQAITIDFNFGSSDITGLQRLRRSDGVVESINTSGSYTDLTWTQINPKKYRMVLTLDGGTGDLFKYDTGAPFVGQ